MLRLRPLLRAARCHYDILGVTRCASDEEIKSAFKDLAKATHPDADKATSSAQGFRDLVEAYRVLRDPKRRSQYNRELDARASASAGRGSQAGFSGQRATGAGAGEAAVPRSPIEGYAIGGLFLGGLFLLSQMLGSQKTAFKDPDPYPRKLPTSGKYAVTAARSADESAPEQLPRESSTAAVSEAVADRAPSATARRGSMLVEGESGMVRAYFDPYMQRWMRIPDGYEPPGCVDLTAWHHKRTDPTEWSRLHASGELSQIMPRGGLQVRYVPKYETHEPIIVGDPITGKTVLAHRRLPPRVSKEQCEVQF